MNAAGDLEIVNLCSTPFGIKGEDTPLWRPHST